MPARQEEMCRLVPTRIIASARLSGHRLDTSPHNSTPEYMQFTFEQKIIQAIVGLLNTNSEKIYSTEYSPQL